jgi:hypothetical protein
VNKETHVEQRQVKCHEDVWTDFVISVLSVNNWSVERTYKLVDGLVNSGLTDTSKLVKLTEAEILQRLKRAGYDRGEYMNRLFAARLTGLREFIETHGVDIATELISEKDRRTVAKTLSGIYGVGPAVIRNFCLLRGI